MTKWTHIILEAYCLYDSAHKKTWVVYEMNNDRSIKKKKCMPNPSYIDAKKRPVWCVKKYANRKERTPEYKCLLDGSCPFLGFVEAEEEDKRLFHDAASV